MKICVYGAGSIGGIIGGVLAEQGEDVSLIARGDHLAALRFNARLLLPRLTDRD